jgi:hypothetical protein
LLTTTKSLQQGVESLGGYRGGLTGRAVTFDDLIGLGLIPPTTFNTATGVGISGVPSGADLQAQFAALCPVRTFAGLPPQPQLGQEAVVTDATTNTWGAVIVAGGGALQIRVWWNGAAWTVIGQ